MTKIEEMNRYVKESNLPDISSRRYSLRMSEIYGLYEALSADMFGGIRMAFNYGMAKGYRMAKSEVRRAKV